MKKLIFFVLVCGIFYSCTFVFLDEHYYLPNDKVPVLKNKDIVYFQDSVNTNKIDTFCLDVEHEIYEDLEKVRWEYYSIYYKKINQKTSLLAYYINTRAYGYLAYGIFKPNLFTQDLDYNNKSETIKYTIYNISYSDVHIAYLDSVLTSDTVPNKVYFTYPNGIIRYEYKDGRVYNLVSK
ncbi:MAG: hypothetical protein PHS84_07215 [Paludibacter sp.]|nr:hypothetical protein [Paludibacter sp.]